MRWSQRFRKATKADVNTRKFLLASLARVDRLFVIALVKGADPTAEGAEIRGNKR